MKNIESQQLKGGFQHDRFEFQSTWLGQKQTFSVVRPSEVTRPRSTIYYFHAGNTGDRMMLEMELFERLDPGTREILVRDAVQVATPNFGLSFLLSSKDDPKRAFSEYFFEEIIPHVENGTDTDAQTRHLCGASLGGHTSLVAFLREPEMFKGVASSIGALLNFDFYSEELFAAYVKEAAINGDFSSNLKQIFHGFFESYEVYRKVDPMLMLQKLEVERMLGKRILLDSGSLDDFGFQIGMSEFSSALKKKGVDHQFELVEGGRHEPVFVMSRFPRTLRFLLGA